MGLYKEDKDAGLPVPSILGLTASPVMRSSANALDEIENTMDARCITPSKHKEELLSYVKPPSLCCILYGPSLEPKNRGIVSNVSTLLARFNTRYFLLTGQNSRKSF
jgi:hypothetical protein